MGLDFDTEQQLIGLEVLVLLNGTRPRILQALDRKSDSE